MSKRRRQQAQQEREQQLIRQKYDQLHHALDQQPVERRDSLCADQINENTADSSITGKSDPSD
jgi:hypothetical protein